MTEKKTTAKKLDPIAQRKAAVAKGEKSAVKKPDPIAQRKAAVTKGEKVTASSNLVSIMNICGLTKVDPNNKRVFPPNQVVQDVKMTNWIEVQVAAKILKVIEDV